MSYHVEDLVRSRYFVECNRAYWPLTFDNAKGWLVKMYRGKPERWPCKYDDEYGWRCSITIKNHDGRPLYKATGDAPLKKDAEKTAALHALLWLHHNRINLNKYKIGDKIHPVKASFKLVEDEDMATVWEAVHDL